MWIRWHDMYRYILELLTHKQQIELLEFCIPKALFYDIVWPTTDSEYMPTSIWPDYQWKVWTTVTRDPEDPRKIISLHTKFLPMANYYNTSAVLKTANERETKEFVKQWKFEVLAFEVRLGLSEESVKLQMVRELDDTVDVDDVQFLIHEIF